MKGIKLEIYRAYHNAGFILALVGGCIIAVIQFALRVVPVMDYIGVSLNIEYPRSVFNTCMMYDMGGFYSYFYYFAIILLASIPHATSYYTDLKGGYVKNVYTRMSRKSYLIGKYAAVFVSAGCVCVIPLLLNILLTASVIPSLIPQLGTSQFPVVGTAMLKALYYTHPWIYTGIYLIIDFIVTGAFACFALVAAKLIYNRYIVLFVPFLAFLIIQLVAQYTYFDVAGPYHVMDASQMVWENLPAVITVIVLLLLISSIPYFLMGGKKRDAL